MKQRIHSIDIIRGLIMVIMTLDHVRDFFHYPGPSPLNLATTTEVLFLTRWLTHFCAPTFVFLAGVSAFLAGQRRSKPQLQTFLIKRGAWLILSDLLIISLIFTLDPGYHTLTLEVLAATGVGMIVLALLLRAPLWLIATIALLIVFGHNLLKLPGVSVFPLGAQRTLFVLYSFLPWTSLLLMGYVAGHLYRSSSDTKRRQKRLLQAGIATTLLFIILRATNVYGDPSPWATQGTPSFTLLSFLNTTKQPPSLLFMSMTLGPILILLSLAERFKMPFFQTFGNVPYFYFILHLTTIRLLNLLLILITGLPIQFNGYPLVWQAEGFGYPLRAVYLIWALVVVALYFPCRWYGRYKKTHTAWWLSYL